MKLLSFVLCTALGLSQASRAQAPVDDFAEFEDPAPPSLPSTATPAAPAVPPAAAAPGPGTATAPPSQPSLQDIGDPDPLDVLDKNAAAESKPAAPAPAPTPVAKPTGNGPKNSAQLPAKPNPQPPAPAPVAKKELAPIPPPEIVQPPAAAPEIAPPPPTIAEPTAPAPAPQEPMQVKRKTGRKVSHEDPNFRVEKRLHEIYKKFNEQPTNVESWDKALGSRKAETYKVQRGDTLWDLSQTFFGESSFWPKVWSLNQDSILNPHEVDPKMTIRFYPGTLGEVPTLGVLTQEKLNEAEKPPMLYMGQAEQPGSIDSLRVPVEPVPKPIGKIPGSMPIYRMGAVHKAPIDYDLPATRLIKTSTQLLQYTFVDSMPITKGKITETEMGLLSAGDYQYVFVKLDEPGDARNFMVVKEKEKVSGGRLLEIQGEIEVLDKVSDSDLYRAIVRKTLGLVEVGAHLVPGSIPRFNTQTQPEVNTAKPVRILTGIHGEHMSMFSPLSYLFLDSGREQGLAVGQTLPIFSNQSARNTVTQVEYMAGSIGRVKIVDVSDNYATGFLLNTAGSIQKGDWVGTPGVTVPIDVKSKDPQMAKAAAGNDDLDSSLDKELEGEKTVPGESAPTAAPKNEPAPDDSSGELQL